MDGACRPRYGQWVRLSEVWVASMRKVLCAIVVAVAWGQVGEAMAAGHFLPEEKPAETLAALRSFHAEGL